jgi:hypothetical protein
MPHQVISYASSAATDRTVVAVGTMMPMTGLESPPWATYEARVRKLHTCSHRAKSGGGTARGQAKGHGTKGGTSGGLGGAEQGSWRPGIPF